MALTSLAFLLVAAPAAEEGPPKYADLAKLIHQLIVPQVPKKHEDFTDWGKTTPVTNDVRLRRAMRTVIQVGEKQEWPHGAWKRSTVWLDDPAKDLRINILKLERIDKERIRVVLEATAAVHGERERQQWIKGLKLIDLTVQGDAVLSAVLDVEVAIALDTKKLPPELSVAPKILDTKLELQRFDLNRVGPVLLGTQEARDLGEELRGFMQGLLKQYEQDVTRKLNEAIASSLKDGKAKLSAATLLQLKLPN